MTAPGGGAGVEAAIKKEVDSLIQDFQRDASGFYRGCLHAHAVHNLGSAAIDGIDDNVEIRSIAGVGIPLPAIPIGEVRAFRNVYPRFVSDVFQAKLILRWQDLLNDVFREYLVRHMDGSRQFVELKSVNPTINFRDAGPMDRQVFEAVQSDFAFWTYSDRFKLINRLRNPDTDEPDCGTRIFIHVQLRNAMQHKHGVLEPKAFAQLGCHEVRLFDDAGTEASYRAGDTAVICVPELERLHKAVHILTERWRA